MSINEKVKNFIFSKILFDDKRKIDNVNELEEFREKIIINIVGKFFVLLLLIFGTIDIFKKRFFIGIIVYAVAVLILFLIYYYNKTQKYIFVSYFIIGILSIFMILLFCKSNSNIQTYFWTLVLPFYYIFFAKIKNGFILSVIYIVLQFTVYYSNIFEIKYSIIFIMRYTIMYFVFTFIAIILEWFRKITYDKLIEKNNEVLETINQLSMTQNSLSASEEKYKSLVENNVDAIAIIRDNNFLYINHRLCSLLNYSKDELMKKKMSSLIPESEHSYLNLHLFQKNISEINPVTFETLIYDSKKNIIDIKIQKSNIIFDNKISYIIVIKDISNRLKLEADKLKASKLIFLDTLINGISHDFNNLLTISLGYIEILNMIHKNDKKTLKYIEKVEKASKRAKNLIEEFTMLSSNELPIKIKEDLYLLITETIKTIDDVKKENISLSFEKEIPNVLCDKKLISLAIGNIIKNSIDSIDIEGKISIKLRKIFLDNNKQQKIKSGDYILISIKDNGCGINKNNLNKIFDPYFSTKDHVTKKGMGFGLAITEKIISNHQGFIKVSSIEFKGTTFLVYLPYLKKTQE
jgi:PAS domain S-box-containing protein